MSLSLEQWLRRIEGLHPREIELGLERVDRVVGALRVARPAECVVSVAGTNGKGSCVAFLDSVARQAGAKTGTYTSPHLQRYNERIRIAGEELGDDEIVRCFEAVEAARGDVPLTYFEFGTLAALTAFRQAGVDLALLEVGLGGRLDAVNAVDASVSVVTSVALDHQRWLGPDREAIGAEKAGIFRPGRPAVVGDADPPRSLLAAASDTELALIGRDFFARPGDDGWSYESRVSLFPELPLPDFGGAEQLANAACALAALERCGHCLRFDRGHVVQGLKQARLQGRFQRLVTPDGKQWILDVAHNQAAAEALAANLARQRCDGRTLAVAGFMRDKRVEAFAAALADRVDAWFAVSPPGQRAMATSDCAGRLQSAGAAPVAEAASVGAGLEAASQAAGPGDRIVVCGSFMVVGPALDYLSRSGAANTPGKG